MHAQLNEKKNHWKYHKHNIIINIEQYQRVIETKLTRKRDKTLCLLLSIKMPAERESIKKLLFLNFVRIGRYSKFETIIGNQIYLSIFKKQSAHTEADNTDLSSWNVCQQCVCFFFSKSIAYKNNTLMRIKNFIENWTEYSCVILLFKAQTIINSEPQQFSKNFLGNEEVKSTKWWKFVVVTNCVWSNHI